MASPGSSPPPFVQSEVSWNRWDQPAPLPDVPALTAQDAACLAEGAFELESLEGFPPQSVPWETV